MENKLNVLEVNNIDVPGRRFNGYDLLECCDDETININQMVIYKQSNNDKVKTFFSNSEQMEMLEKLEKFETDELSIHSNLSITSPALINSDIYKQSDILHFHMFHNTKLSLMSLIKMCNDKKVVMSFHDPWYITGRCVHFEECMKWKNGCNECHKLNTLFPFKEDNCNTMWKLKQMVYKRINPDIVVSSKYMYDLVKESPLTSHFTNIHIIPLGIDLEIFNDNIGKQEARKKLNIPSSDVVLFLRAQNAFKGTNYVLEALKKLNTDKNITVITCDEKNRLDNVKDRYNIIDMGNINNEQLLYAYNACDMFLMPSIGETFGMMAIEAMACSRPVIVFNNTALPSVTYAPECGVLVDNKNSDKLMEAIEFLINNDEERERRGKLGRKICEENYSISKYNERLIELYKQIEQIDKNEVKNVSNTEGVSEENIKIKYKLNKFTEANFKKGSKIYNELIFNNIEKLEGEIDYSDIEVQKTINDYNNKLYINLSNKKTNSIFVQIKNAVKLVLKDRNRLKNSIQYKLQQKFGKKG